MRTERADEMRGFEISGFGPEDAGHVQRSADYLGPLVPAVLDALYDHLLSLPETRDCFNRTFCSASGRSSSGSPER